MAAAASLRASAWQPALGRLHAANRPDRTPRRPHAVRCFANGDSGTVAIKFQLPYHCKFGQKMCLIGGSDNLGAWHIDRAVPMSWTEGDVWVAELQLPADGRLQLEYKYVVRSEHDMTAVRWKEGGNFSLQLPAQGRLRVRDTWDESDREVEFENQHQQHQAAAAQVQQQSAAAQAPQQAQPPTQPVPVPVAVEAALQPPPAPQRRPRRKKDEDAEVAAAISKAADKAMSQLDAAVSRSLDLLGATGDPAAPELLAADRLLAAAARRAATMNKALDAAKEAKMLPPAGTKAATKASVPRRRRVTRKDAPAPPSTPPM